MARTMIIRRIAPLSVAKIAGTVYGILGLIFGAMIALFSSVSSTFLAAQTRAMSPLLGLVMGIGAIVILPVFYGVLGFLSALVFAWIYNLIASKIGGIEIDIA